GAELRWMDEQLDQSVTLPGTMAEWGKGWRRLKGETTHLNVDWQYSGAAWYQRQIDLPAHWTGKIVRLVLERTKATTVWIDGKIIRSSRILSAAQRFELPRDLPPGAHQLTIRVDNDPDLFPVGGSHALSEHTQTNWNGIIGSSYL